MARKNLIEASDTHAPVTDFVPSRDTRPIAGFVPTTRNVVPVGGITKTLGNITEKMERAENLERQLAEGQMVVELDPSLVDGSFVNDRLEIDPAELQDLAEQIRIHGQQVPILVRKSPDDKGRFQVAYGHRRLAAAKSLGLKVRAVVRELTDEQLVVSQGQENNARTNLSYVERALFASKLEKRAFTRDIIMSALGVDKAALSKMLIVIRQIPLELISAIGSAPEVGRRRWMELAEQVEHRDVSEIVTELSAIERGKMTSDERFQFVSRKMTTVDAKPAPIIETAGEVPVKIRRTSAGATFVFNDKLAPGFDAFVKDRLEGLFAEFKLATGD